MINKKSSYFVIGVMSGTSLDGLDLAAIRFHCKGNWRYEILCAETIGYSQHWRSDLKNAIHLNAQQLERLNFKFTEMLSEEILAFIQRNGLREVDAVCSHGHTVFHKPEKGYTYQIGNLPRLAKLISRKVVCDFRVQDVAFGGQGAPLVPIGDQFLFSEYDACLNLGGFANISMVKDQKRMAYDICAVNSVLNVLAERCGVAYDENGGLARQGRLHPELLQALNSLDFYKKESPKSLGIEWVTENIFTLLNTEVISPIDLLRTYTEHVVEQLQKHLKGAASVLVTGGGAYNSFLISKLKEGFEDKIVLPDEKLIDFKEALIFGLLGVLKLRDEVNCLASVTGAFKDHSSGKIFLP